MSIRGTLASHPRWKPGLVVQSSVFGFTPLSPFCEALCQSRGCSCNGTPLPSGLHLVVGSRRFVFLHHCPWYLIAAASAHRDGPHGGWRIYIYIYIYVYTCKYIYILTNRPNPSSLGHYVQPKVGQATHTKHSLGRPCEWDRGGHQHDQSTNAWHTITIRQTYNNISRQSVC